MLELIFRQFIWLFAPKRYRWKLLSRFGYQPPDWVIKRDINRRYHKSFGATPDLTHPIKWSEKLQYLKLHYRDEAMIQAADKLAVRDMLKQQGLSSILIRHYATYQTADEIDFDQLPQQFVLKVTHDSGGVVVVKNKDELDQTAVREKLNKSIAYPYAHGIRSGEWHYLHIKPQIIAEKYLCDSQGKIRDYRIQCFAGVPRLIMVDEEIEGQVYSASYDTNWQKTDLQMRDPLYNGEIKPPRTLKRMLEIASQLSTPFPYSRVDLYEIDGEIYFGELTFFHGSGLSPITPECWDLKMGEWLPLRVYNH